MRETLERGLPELGIDPAVIPALEQFAEMMLERNKVMNLTAITEPRDVAALHLLDSLALLPLAGLENERLVDVGCGAGFPGVPLAIAGRRLEVTLLDSQRKRVDFLEEARAALGLENAVCVHARAEEFAGERRDQFDAAVSRAVAALPVLCELCLPFVKVGGRFLAMKGPDCGGEIQDALPAIHLLGGEIAGQLDYAIPHTQVTHRVIVVHKVTHSPEKYPRRWAKMQKSPLQPGPPPGN